ncbi:hypothetical protein AB1Y20_002574 [Prymnesium parvum]|uniref:Uncharacterized protein n=1 Tax=Prymnesium parvum TaxID=97485 RepID=A0AB34JB89_PRYPA
MPTPHEKRVCEQPGCQRNFYFGGRHHCRQCGNSVCDRHFVRPCCTICTNTPTPVHHNRMACEAPGCGKAFMPPLRRRHHCRECGSSVCEEHFMRPTCLTCIRDNVSSRGARLLGLQSACSTPRTTESVSQPRDRDNATLSHQAETARTVTRNSNPFFDM